MGKDKSFEFKIYTGHQISVNGQDLLGKLRDIVSGYEMFDGEDIMQFLSAESIVCCMFDGEEILGFAWLEFSDEERIAELGWFITDKEKTKGLESKLLLDRVLDYCKERNISSVKFNCAQESWGRIKDEKLLLKRFGYNLSEDEGYYDVSIDL